MLAKLKPLHIQLSIIILALLFGILAAVFINRAEQRNAIANDPGKLKIVDKPFPSVHIKSFDGKLDLFSEVSKGKTLLVYTSTKCKGCQIEARLLAENSLSEKFGIKVFLGGSEDKQAFKQFMSKYKLDVPIFFDRDQKLRQVLDIKGTPANFLIIEGKIKRSWVGAHPDIERLYEKLGL